MKLCLKLQTSNYQDWHLRNGPIELRVLLHVCFRFRIHHVRMLAVLQQQQQPQSKKQLYTFSWVLFLSSLKYIERRKKGCVTNNSGACSGSAMISLTIFSMRADCDPLTKIVSPSINAFWIGSLAISEFSNIIIFPPKDFFLSSFAVNLVFGPTKKTRLTPASTIFPAISRCPQSLLTPSSAISPIAANFRPIAMLFRTSNAAFTESGAAL